ncbi:MAG TPA: serine/threonine-protein kinase [Polyangiaceae bacterium]
MAESPPLVGTVLDGRFQVEKALASGASGDVYEAQHLALGHRVAIKILRPGIPETAEIRRKRFLREARVAVRIRSDHVVRVFDFVAPEEGPTYIVMELLHGETLADRVRRGGPLPCAEAVDFVVQAAKPLAQLHGEGIVHRDVKPSNLFLERDAEGKERIKLLDFGVAAFQQPVSRPESSLTWSEMIVGTPRYMAPEQIASSKQVDARADVWALGVTLYELLSGEPPFGGTTVLAVLNQIEHQEPPPLSTRRPDVPPQVAAVVHRCLSKDPASRPADARALVEALTQPTSVEGSAPDRRRWPRLAWVAAPGAGLLVVVGLALAGHKTEAEPASPEPVPSLVVSSPPPPQPMAVSAATATTEPPPLPPASPAAAQPARPAVQRRPSAKPAPRATSRTTAGTVEDDDRIE